MPRCFASLTTRSRARASAIKLEFTKGTGSEPCCIIILRTGSVIFQPIPAPICSINPKIRTSLHNFSCYLSILLHIVASSGSAVILSQNRFAGSCVTDGSMPVAKNHILGRPSWTWESRNFYGKWQRNHSLEV